MFNNLIYIPIIVISFSAVVQMISLSKKREKRSFNNEKALFYTYHAKTIFRTLDHKYKFSIEKVNGEYRCYILSKPKYRSGNVSRYNPHCWIETGTDRRYICWTGRILSTSQAKALCRLWGDKTQLFIDTGKPAPGFEKVDD